jgi:hypothetical protein
MKVRPIAPRNWELNKAKASEPTVFFNPARPGKLAINRPTTKTLEKRKARITLAKVTFLD